MTYIFMRAFAPLINIFTIFVNLFIRRDKEIILFGSWMGDKFTDNPRFLFQYLYEHIEEYNIKKIIWVTRNKAVYNMLRDAQYEVYMMHSIKSIYYHFKAGVHMICNISFPVKGYAGDIMGQFSGNAIKINMFHGVAIKAGKSTGENSKKQGIIGKIRYVLRNSNIFNSIFTVGYWNKAYQLSTGEECTRRDSIFCGVDPNLFIESGYPRNCKPIKLMPQEQEIVDYIREHNKVILYVPTFREHGEVPHPLSDEKLLLYIVEKGYLWVEKPHPAAKNTVRIEGFNNNVLYLDSSFDINVVLPEISILISDYSSVSYDAIAFDKPVLYYAPDYKYYLTSERGFLCDYLSLIAGFEATSVEELINKLEKAFFDPEYRNKLIEKSKDEKKFVLNANKEDCGQIIDSISERLGILQKKQKN